MAGYVSDCPEELRASTRLPWYKVQCLVPSRRAGKGGQQLRSSRKHPLLLVSADPVRIELIFDQIIPLPSPAINKIPTPTAGVKSCTHRGISSEAGWVTCHLPPPSPPNYDTLNESISSLDPCNAYSPMSRAPHFRSHPERGFSYGEDKEPPSVSKLPLPQPVTQAR